ncbi:hypothetical protein J3F83DRAFT_273677 [Trichoderma novae-zelandiae]
MYYLICISSEQTSSLRRRQDSTKMATQCDTSQRNKDKQPSSIGQAKRNPRFAQFPKVPVKPQPSKESPRETACERVLAPREEEPPGRHGGERRWCGETPAMLRRVGQSPGEQRDAVIAGTRERRNAAVYLPSSVATAEDKARQRRRRLSQHAHAAQRTRGPRRAFTPQLSIKVPAAAAGPHPSKQWNRVRSIFPAARVPAAKAATVRFPLSRGPSPDAESPPPSPSIPTSTRVCFLCRRPSDSKGGLCGACTAEYAMPSSGLDDDGDDDEDEESRIRVRSPRSYSSSVYSDSSSVYSLDAAPVNDDALTVSNLLVDDADDSILHVSPCSTVGKAFVSERTIRVMYPRQHENGDSGNEYEDLYGLDWAEYYFNDEYFADAKGGLNNTFI